MNFQRARANQPQLKDHIPLINSKKRRANPKEIKTITRTLREKK